MLTATHVLLLPGWLDSGPLHWQSLWQAAHGYTRVQQHDWQRPLRGDWCARLEEVVVNHVARSATAGVAEDTKSAALATAKSTSSPPKVLLRHEQAEQNLLALEPDLPSKSSPGIVLVAHSLGCHLVAAWAAASRHTSAVRGVLLVAPPDVTQANLPPDLHGWRTPILGPLPFPGICVVSDNDPFASPAAGRALAAAWGARCVNAGSVGHLNSDSGLGHWPAGHAFVTELAALPHKAASKTEDSTKNKLVDNAINSVLCHPT